MTDRLTDEQIKELERLDAWPRPWRTYTSTEGDESDIVADNAAYPDEIAHLAEFADERDARLAVLAVNALPSLIAEILASRAARAESEGTGEEPAAVPYTGSRARRSVGNCPCGGELVQFTGARTPQAQCLKCKAWRWPAPASRDGQARTLPVRTARRLSGDDLRDAARRLSPQPAMEDYEDASRDGQGETAPAMTWGVSTDEESFHGHYASKEEALANAVSELGLEPGQRFWVGGGRPYRPARSVEADALFDKLVEDAGDECGEVSEDWLADVGTMARIALQDEVHAAVTAWLHRTGNMPRFYCCEVVEAHTVPGPDEGTGGGTR